MPSDENVPQWLIDLKDQRGTGGRPRNKPHGRWLGDFLDQIDPGGLLPAEMKLLNATLTGTACHLGTDREWPERDEIRIRPSLLRFLALGGDESVPIHELGINVEGAFIDGEIDLSRAKCAASLSLTRCYIGGALVIEGASLGNLTLTGSRVVGIKGDRAAFAGPVYLNDGFYSGAIVSFVAATIGGDLDCTDGVFTKLDNEENALHCRGTKITGNVHLCNRFASSGRVSFASAVIAGDLRLSGATIKVDKGLALDCDVVTVGGSVFLNVHGEPSPQRFPSVGSVSFYGAEIKSDLDCSGGSFAYLKGSEPELKGRALNLNGAEIAGIARLSRTKGTNSIPFEANGCVALYGTNIGVYLDCEGGRFMAPEVEVDVPQPAIEGTSIKVTGCVFLDYGFTSDEKFGSLPRRSASS
jgi:hypothetical protein